MTTSLLLALASLGQIPAPQTHYFLVESRAISADGKPLGALAGLTRREYRPSESTIVETSLAVDPAPSALPTITVTEWTVSPDGTSATLKDRAGRLSGEAKLVGPAWRWTDWTWTGTLKDVTGTFRNAAKVTPHGLAIKTERVDAGGKRLDTFEEIDTRISKESYDLLRSKLLPR